MSNYYTLAWLIDKPINFGIDKSSVEGSITSQRKRKPLAPRTGSILAEQDTGPVYSQIYTAIEEVENIKEGDLVRHKIMDYLNNGLPFLVLATDRCNALCSYMDELSKAPIITWYEKAELIKVRLATENQIED